MKSRSDEKLSAALTMLEEARDYMTKLPPVPVTLQFVRKLNEFLDTQRDPLFPWQGTAYAPDGRRLLEAELLDKTLTLRLARQGSVKFPTEDLQRYLASREGVTIVLTHPTAPGDH